MLLQKKLENAKYSQSAQIVNFMWCHSRIHTHIIRTTEESLVLKIIGYEDECGAVK